MSKFSLGLLALFTWFCFSYARAENCTVKVSITGVVGPSTVDLLERSQKRAEDNKCRSMLVVINTPGGSLQSTRYIVEQILNSEIPYLCLVSPAGGHAGSAGAIILQACHVNGAVLATNIGAATPVSGFGENLSEDLRQKIVNDTRSWVEGIVKLRGRNLDFGKQIVEKAMAVEASEAYRIKAIDLLVKDEVEFLTNARGRIVKGPKDQTMNVEVGTIVTFDQDLRFRILDLIADPQIAYILFMGSLALLYFELTHPGTIAPGVLGAMGLILSLLSFHKLDVSWAGLALMVLGLIFLIAEAFVPSFGALGVGGLVSFVLGGIFLFDPAKTGFQLPLSLVLGTALVLSGLLLGIGFLAVRSFRQRKKGAYDDLLGEESIVIEVDSADGCRGWIEIQGERWKVLSSVPLRQGSSVRVEGYKGLVLEVVPVKE